VTVGVSEQGSMLLWGEMDSMVDPDFHGQEFGDESVWLINLDVPVLVERLRDEKKTTKQRRSNVRIQKT
jgi:hypothetical protein